MKRILKIILKAYMILCTALFSLLLIAAIIVLINFGKVTSFVIEKAVDNFNTELNSIVSGFFLDSMTDNTIQFESITTIPGGGLQASFTVDNSVVTDFDMNNIQNKTNMELIEEFGITLNDIPLEARNILSMVNQKLVLNFKDGNGNPVINREISSREIAEFLK